MRKCGFFLQNCKQSQLNRYISIKSLQITHSIDLFYCALFQFKTIHGILAVVIDMDVDKKLIGRRVRHRREAADLSQDQLAEKLGLSKNHISSIECGKSLLTTKRLLALCDVLGETPDYYLIGEITPETDAITTLVKRLSPKEQKMLLRFLTTYLENVE